MQKSSIKYILKLSIPIFFANLAVPLVGIIDTSLMGNLEELSYLSATSIAAISGEGNNFGPEMERLSTNIAALNGSYEIQLKSSQDYISGAGQMKDLQDSIQSVMADLAASAGDTQVYRENMATLSQNLSDLNNVYGNMLKAMKS